METHRAEGAPGAPRDLYEEWEWVQDPWEPQDYDWQQSFAEHWPAGPLSFVINPDAELPLERREAAFHMEGNVTPCYTNYCVRPWAVGSWDGTGANDLMVERPDGALEPRAYSGGNYPASGARPPDEVPSLLNGQP